MQSGTHRALLILADISGYTEFMLANQLTLVHGQQLISRLIEALIEEIEIPLELKEIEGDAVFLYARDSGDEAAWREACAQVSRKLLRFFEVFAETLVEAAESTLCRCASCQKADRLKLKIVVHAGEALFHSIGRFPDVSGVDVILAHRLLKNSVAGDEYLLLTDAARQELTFPEEVRFEAGSERYEGFGAVRTHVFQLADPRPAAREHFHAAGLLRTSARAMARNLAAVGGQFPALWRSGALARRHEVAAGPLARLGTGLLLVLLTPIEIAAIVLATPLRIARRRRASA